MEENNVHRCHMPKGAKNAIYGDAITDCWEDKKGLLWVDNDEYGSQVNFCPYCGYEAKVKINL